MVFPTDLRITLTPLDPSPSFFKSDCTSETVMFSVTEVPRAVTSAVQFSVLSSL